MSSGLLRDGCIAAGLLLGLLAPAHAGPTRLDDTPASTDAGKPLIATDDAAFAMPVASTPARSRRDAYLPPADTTSARGDDALRARDDTLLTAEPRQNAARADQVSGSDDDGFSVRNFAKSARDWARDLVPWRSSPAVAPSVSVKAMPADDLILPAETAGSASTVFTVHVEKAPPRAAATVEAGNSSSRTAAADNPASHLLDADPQGDNAIRRVVRFSRALFVHPLTWLAVVVIAIAHILVTRAGRRKR